MAVNSDFYSDFYSRCSARIIRYAKMYSMNIEIHEPELERRVREGIRSGRQMQMVLVYLPSRQLAKWIVFKHYSDFFRRPPRFFRNGASSCSNIESPGFASMTLASLRQ